MKDKAIFNLYPAVKQIAMGVCYDSQKNIIEVDEQLIATKVAELTAKEPMRILREERNRKLAQTDWRASSDLTLSNEWATYRQALRDLPANSTPTLDSDGNLQNVTWPSEPS